MKNTKIETADKLTQEEFRKRFKGVIGPEYWGASYPEFQPCAINEEKFEKACRYKNFLFCFDERTQSVKVNWVSQEECDPHQKFDAELIRCFTEIGVSGRISVKLRNRDGNMKFEYDLPTGERT